VVTRHPIGVLDTNAVVLLGELDPDELPDEPVITAVTLAELSVGPLVTDDPYERAARQSRLQGAESAFDSLYTCNPRDFSGMSDLDMVAIPHPG
jgi:tRNA(fMet)-specific endonuclease VapC